MCKISKMMKELRYLSNQSRASASQKEKREAISIKSERKIADLKRIKSELQKK